MCSAPTTHPLLILKHLQVGVSMSAILETPKAAQIAETNVTTEVAETDVQTIKSEVDPLQEEVSTSLSKKKVQRAVVIKSLIEILRSLYRPP